MSKKLNLSGAGALFVAAFIYATFGVLARVVSGMWSNEGQVIARLLVACLLASVISFWVKPVKMPIKKLLNAIALGLSFGVVMLLYTYSVRHTTIANTIFLLYAGSIVTSLALGSLVFKEKITIIKLMAIVLALCGLGVYANSIIAASAGIITGLLSGVFDGGSNSLRKSLGGISRFAALRVQYAAATVVGVIAALFSHTPLISQVTWQGTIGIVVWGILLVCLGNLLLFGFQHFDLNVGTVILSSELAFAAILGLVFYQEIPQTHELIGGMLIFTASVLSGIDPKRLALRRKGGLWQKVLQ